MGWRMEENAQVEGRIHDRYLLSEEGWAEVENRLTYHPPLPGQSRRYAELRFRALELARFVSVQCPPSRETSLALTSLEQAVFWANAAIARNEKALDEDGRETTGE
jgi:hypothetical protein